MRSAGAMPGKSGTCLAPEASARARASEFALALRAEVARGTILVELA